MACKMHECIIPPTTHTSMHTQTQTKRTKKHTQTHTHTQTYIQNPGHIPTLTPRDKHSCTRYEKRRQHENANMNLKYSQIFIFKLIATAINLASHDLRPLQIRTDNYSSITTSYRSKRDTFLLRQNSLSKW